MRTREPKFRGFTLIELLVVIVIIMVVTTMSLALLGFFARGASVKGCGRALEGLFMRARQLAASKRQRHFLLFHPDHMTEQYRRRPFVLLIEDTNRNGHLQLGFDISHYDTAEGRYRDRLTDGPANGDTIIGEPYELPRGVVFNTNTALFTSAGGGPFRIGFNHDGSLYLGATGDSPIIDDAPGNVFSGGNPVPGGWDIGIRDIGSGSTDGMQDVGVRMYMDYKSTTGKLTKKFFVAQ